MVGLLTLAVLVGAVLLIGKLMSTADPAPAVAEAPTRTSLKLPVPVPVPD
jgi:hypothetical protein